MPQATEVISLGCRLRQPQARQLLIKWLCDYLSTSLTFIIANLGKKKKVNVHLCLPLYISCLFCFPSGPPSPRPFFGVVPSAYNQSSFQPLSLYFDMSAQWLMGLLEPWYNTITFSIFLSMVTDKPQSLILCPLMVMVIPSGIKF